MGFFDDLSSSDSKALKRFSTFLSFITRSCSKSFGFKIKGSGASIFGLSGDLDFATIEVLTKSEIEGKITFLLAGEVLADPASTPCFAFSREEFSSTKVTFFVLPCDGTSSLSLSF